MHCAARQACDRTAGAPARGGGTAPASAAGHGLRCGPREGIGVVAVQSCLERKAGGGLDTVYVPVRVHNTASTPRTIRVRTPQCFTLPRIIPRSTLGRSDPARSGAWNLAAHLEHGLRPLQRDSPGARLLQLLRNSLLERHGRSVLLGHPSWAAVYCAGWPSPPTISSNGGFRTEHAAARRSRSPSMPRAKNGGILPNPPPRLPNRLAR